MSNYQITNRQRYLTKKYKWMIETGKITAEPILDIFLKGATDEHAIMVRSTTEHLQKIPCSLPTQSIERLTIPDGSVIL
jgi:hypothetical protein